MLNNERVLDVIETAGYAMGYWCASAVVMEDEMKYWIRLHDDETQQSVTKGAWGDGWKDVTLSPEYTLTFADIKRAIRSAVSIDRAARDIAFASDDDLDYDAFDAERMIQYACFGCVVFG